MMDKQKLLFAVYLLVAMAGCVFIELMNRYQDRVLGIGFLFYWAVIIGYCQTTQKE